METVGTLINCLTNNEDLRQDLWVYYLSGNPVEALPSYLQKISVDYSEDIQIKYNLWHMMNSDMSERFPEFLNYFSDFEQSMICRLMLGLSISQISEYEGISEVRIRQTVSNLRYNIAWRQFYGVEETSVGR